MGFERNFRCKLGLESSYGDGGSTPTDLPLFNESVPVPSIDKHENPVYGGSLGRNTFFTGKSLFDFSGVKFFLKGSGTAGTAPELSKLLRICGLGETVTPATSVVYSPVNSSFASGTLTLNLDGVEYVLAGARAEKLTIPLEGGQPVIAEIAIKALYAAPTAQSFAAPTFADAAIVPPIVSDMALTIGAQSYVMPKLTLELMNIINVKDSVNGTHRGVQEIAIVGREYGGSFQVEVDANNDTEFWTALLASTELAVAATGFGSAGNRIKFTTSTLQIEDVKPSSLNGVRMYDVSFRINKHATLASEFSLSFL